jgi:hypothetical protein
MRYDIEVQSHRVPKYHWSVFLIANLGPSPPPPKRNKKTKKRKDKKKKKKISASITIAP